MTRGATFFRLSAEKPTAMISTLRYARLIALLSDNPYGLARTKDTTAMRSVNPSLPDTFIRVSREEGTTAPRSCRQNAANRATPASAGRWSGVSTGSTTTAGLTALWSIAPVSIKGSATWRLSSIISRNWLNEFCNGLRETKPRPDFGYKPSYSYLTMILARHTHLSPLSLS